MRYEIIQEYPKYYLTKAEAGFKECFSKCENRIRYTIVDEKYIVKMKQKDEEEKED